MRYKRGYFGCSGNLAMLCLKDEWVFFFFFSLKLFLHLFLETVSLQEQPSEKPRVKSGHRGLWIDTLTGEWRMWKWLCRKHNNGKCVKRWKVNSSEECAFLPCSSLPSFNLLLQYRWVEWLAAHLCQEGFQTLLTMGFPLGRIERRSCPDRTLLQPRSCWSSQKHTKYYKKQTGNEEGGYCPASAKPCCWVFLKPLS